MLVDLHIHTYFSDGTQSPEEVVAAAKEQGLSVISVCDHNTVGAYERLVPACEAAKIKLIQGLEIDVAFGNERLHLLAYGFDPCCKALLEVCRHNLSEYEAAGIALIKNMAKDYPEISIDDFLEYEHRFGRGGWKSLNYIYDRGLSSYIIEGSKYFTKYGDYNLRLKDVGTVCEIVHDAGGVSILAHPGNYWQEHKLHDNLSAMMRYGISGVECFHPRHTKSVEAICVRICEDNDLYITGGGDGHGEFFRNGQGAFYNDGAVCDIGVNQISVSVLKLPFLG